MNYACDLLNNLTLNTERCIPLANFLGYIEVLQGLNGSFTHRYFGSVQADFKLEVHNIVSLSVQVKHTESGEKKIRLGFI